MVWKKRETLKGLAKSSGVAKLYQDGHYLEITHVPTGYVVRFAAFLDSISDAYTSDWRAEQVYGRMDPIATFSHTRRALSVAWRVPAESALSAKHNLDEVSKLLSFLYPLYHEGVGTAINMGPLMRVKFGNLIQDAATGNGLLGYINGFTMDPQFEDGFFMFDRNPYATVGSIGERVREIKSDIGTSGDVEYYPKSITLNFEMNVLHEHSLGWVKKEGKAGDNATSIYYFRGGSKGFPYASEDGPPVNPDEPAKVETGSTGEGPADAQQFENQSTYGPEEAQEEKAKQRKNKPKPGDPKNAKANKVLKPRG